jgi:hypothetical protein
MRPDCLDFTSGHSYAYGYECSVEPGQEFGLAALAAYDGITVSELVANLLAPYLVDDEFIRAVEQGRASADRGNVIDHDQAVRRIEQHFTA